MKSTLYSLLLLVAFIFSATAKAQNNTSLVFAPELGKKYTLSAEISAAFTREGTEEKKAKNKTGNVILTFSFVPKRINKNGNYEIECLLNRAVVKSTKNGEVREDFDSDAVTDQAKEGKNNRTVAAFKETPLVFEVNKVGQMVGVTGIEAIDKKISEGEDTAAGMRLIRDKEYYEKITTILKAAFNHFTSFYGTKPMQVGDNWNVAIDTTMFKALRFPELQGKDNYTVSDNSNGLITINGSSTFKFEKEKDQVASVVKESVIKIDAATGLVQNAKFVYTAAEPLTEEESKTKKPENVTFTITVGITPAN